ncbi:hypothetical protein KEM52_004160, partial [Ascosphaera acerosa]
MRRSRCSPACSRSRATRPRRRCRRRTTSCTPPSRTTRSGCAVSSRSESPLPATCLSGPGTGARLTGLNGAWCECRVAQVDDFVAKLWGVHTAVKEEAGGYAQDLSVGLFRSDYIAHRPRSEEKAALKQVEFNTIAASFAGLSAKVAALHTALITDPGSPYPERDMFLRNVHGVRPPENRAVQTLAAGLAAAHAAYGPNKAALVDGSGAGA